MAKDSNVKESTITICDTLRTIVHGCKMIVKYYVDRKSRLDLGDDDDLMELVWRKCSCIGCKYRKGGRCTLCGCFISYKTALRNEECPINRWKNTVVIASVKESIVRSFRERVQNRKND